MAREKLATAVARHLESDFGGEPGKKDALMLLADTLDQLVDERLPRAAIPVAPAPGIDEATLRRVVDEAVAKALPSPAAITTAIERAVADALPASADMPKMLQAAVSAGLFRHQTGEGEKILHEIAELRRVYLENRWPLASGPAVSSKSELVDPNFWETIQIMGAWLHLCKMPVPREDR